MNANKLPHMRSLLESAPLAAARAALDGLTRRQEAVASNIANVDTVGYRRKSVTFESALKDSIAAARGEQRLRVTNSGHVPTASASGRDMSGVETRDVVASRNDDNRVSIDEEMAMLADTQLRYQALTQSINGRLGTLRNIIRGGR